MERSRLSHYRFPEKPSEINETLNTLKNEFNKCSKTSKLVAHLEQIEPYRGSQMYECDLFFKSDSSEDRITSTFALLPGSTVIITLKDVPVRDLDEK